MILQTNADLGLARVSRAQAGVDTSKMVSILPGGWMPQSGISLWWGIGPSLADAQISATESGLVR